VVEKVLGRPSSGKREMKRDPFIVRLEVTVRNGGIFGKGVCSFRKCQKETKKNNEETVWKLNYVLKDILLERSTGELREGVANAAVT